MSNDRRTSPGATGNNEPRSKDSARERRIQRLKDELIELSGGKVIFGPVADCPPEILEAFLENVLKFERAHALNPIPDGPFLKIERLLPPEGRS